jgi:hypothetical protein
MIALMKSGNRSELSPQPSFHMGVIGEQNEADCCLFEWDAGVMSEPVHAFRVTLRRLTGQEYAR